MRLIGRIGVITLTLWRGWLVDLLEVDWGNECLPYQMGPEDEDERDSSRHSTWLACITG